MKSFCSGLQLLIHHRTVAQPQTKSGSGKEPLHHPTSGTNEVQRKSVLTCRPRAAAVSYEAEREVVLSSFGSLA